MNNTTSGKSDAFIHEGLYFRLPVEDDLQTLQNLRNHPSTWIHLLDPNIIGPADQRAWFDSIGWRNGRMYLVVYDNQHPFIGLVMMDEFDRQNRSLRVGLNIVPGLRQMGYGKKTYAAIKAYAFNHLNIHRLWLAVMDSNKNAINLYEKSGFKVEGRYREAIFRDGKYVDYVIMSCLEQEYRKETK